MDKSKTIFMPTDSELSSLGRSDFDGCYAIDITGLCFGNLDLDPWDSMRSMRACFKDSRLMLTVGGQSLLGRRHYSDEIVEFFVAAAAQNGIDIFRVYDALGDARNLETAAKSVKKYGAHLQAAMVYTESPVHSLALFAGYAAQLAAMGADSICVCDVTDEFACRELVEAVRSSSSLPITVSESSEKIAYIALDAGAEAVQVYNNADYPAELASEIARVRADAGDPPLAYPISDIIAGQARINVDSGERYSSVTEDFRSLILGGYGKTPAPVSQNFTKLICGGAPLVLVRPADILPPEYDKLRDAVAPWIEQEEDILTYAIFGGEAVDLFERRKAKKYALDLLHADPLKGIHII